MVRLVLVRHGQSVWNKENRFTGWADVPLSKEGVNQARDAGEKLKNINFKNIYTSELMRAQQTLFEILEINEKINGKYFLLHKKHKERYNRFLKKNPDMNYSKVNVSEKLNERDYGYLEGINKDEARKKYGQEQVHIWRRSYDVGPPGGECLKDTKKRTLPYFKRYIMSHLKNEENVLIVAHGNSLRAITMEIEKLDKDQIMEVDIPTGIPIVYEIDETTLEVVGKKILK